VEEEVLSNDKDGDEDAVRRLMIAPQFIRPHKIQDQDHFLLFVLLCVH